MYNQKEVAWYGIKNWSLFKMYIGNSDFLALVLAYMCQLLQMSQSFSLCLFRPVSSFLHISSSCSSYSYRSCHLSALCAFESTSTAALHSILPSGHSALHELYSILPQVRLWWTWKWGTETKDSFDSQCLSSHKNIVCHIKGYHGRKQFLLICLTKKFVLRQIRLSLFFNYVLTAWSLRLLL